MAKKTKRERCIQKGNHGKVWQLTRRKEIKRKNKYDCAASRLGVLRNSDAVKRVSQAGRKKENLSGKIRNLVLHILSSEINFQ